VISSLGWGENQAAPVERGGSSEKEEEQEKEEHTANPPVESSLAKGGINSFCGLRGYFAWQRIRGRIIAEPFAVRSITDHSGHQEGGALAGVVTRVGGARAGVWRKH